MSIEKYWNMWKGKPCWNPLCEQPAQKEFGCLHGFFCSKECMNHFHKFIKTFKAFEEIKK